MAVGLTIRNSFRNTKKSVVHSKVHKEKSSFEIYKGNSKTWLPFFHITIERSLIGGVCGADNKNRINFRTLKPRIFPVGARETVNYVTHDWLSALLYVRHTYIRSTIVVQVVYYCIHITSEIKELDLVYKVDEKVVYKALKATKATTKLRNS